MKKVLLIAILILCASAVFAGPCTLAWNACAEINGNHDAGCDAGWRTCMLALYG